MRRIRFFESRWGFATVVAFLSLFLILTNPSQADVMKWVERKEVASISNGVHYSYFRGKTYWFFSYHEIKLEANDYATTRTYIGLCFKLIPV